EVVKPALSILAEKRFRAANEEFGKAHQHYRQRRYQESIADCLKAFESTMKVICATHKWPSNPGVTAKALIKTCFDHDLIPGYLESQFASLRSVWKAASLLFATRRADMARVSLIPRFRHTSSHMHCI